jgi:pyruvate carboxylase
MGVLPAKGAPEPIVLKNQQGGEGVGNRTITDSPDLAERLNQRMSKHGESAAEILKYVRAQTSGK